MRATLSTLALILLLAGCGSSADGPETATDIPVDSTTESPSTTATTAAPTTTAPVTTAAAEALSFQLLNEMRASRGESPLVRDETLDAFARTWAATMDSLGQLQHSGGPYAENLAWSSNGSVSADAAARIMHDLWVESESHYNTMTRNSYSAVGIGFSQSAGGWYAPHVFRQINGFGAEVS